MTNFNNLKPIEPLMANRWIIKTIPEIIDDFLFRKYKFYNDGDKLIFETEFFETVHGVITPGEIMNITDIQLQYLDPIGNVVAGHHMTIKGINFIKEHDYTDDGLLVTHLYFEIKDTHPIFTKKTETPIDVERCVQCGKDTGVLKSSNIDGRLSYVEGAGQLCSMCFLECYKNAK